MLQLLVVDVMQLREEKEEEERMGGSLQDVIPELAELPVVPTLPFTLPSYRVPYFIYKVDGSLQFMQILKQVTEYQILNAKSLYRDLFQTCL
jgi:hypothetical protein